MAILPSPRTRHPVTITIWSTGSPYREFLFVDVLAEDCIFLMQNINFCDNKAHSPGAHSDIKTSILILVQAKDLTIKELAQMIKGIVWFAGQLNWDSSKPDGTSRKLLDVSKINKLGWNEKFL